MTEKMTNSEENTENQQIQNNEERKEQQPIETKEENTENKSIGESKNDTFIAVIDAFSNGLTLRKALYSQSVSHSDWTKALIDRSDIQLAFETAKRHRADLIADDLLDIVDDETLEVGRAFNMMRARQWLASKYAPKTFGDKLDVTVTKTVDITLALSDARKRLDAIEAETAEYVPIPLEKQNDQS